MAEGRVYLCKWERKEDIYYVWVEKRPRLRADGWSLDEACQELAEKICGQTGDGEAVLELDPPRDGAGAGSFLSIYSNSTWTPPKGITHEECCSLYEGGICNGCFHGIGERTKIPLPVGKFYEGELLGSGMWFCNSMLASDRFRDLLTRREQAALEWRSIDYRGKSCRKFFEVIPKNWLPMVAERDQSLSGWICPHCRRRSFTVANRYCCPFISADDVPSPRTNFFGVRCGVNMDVDVALLRSRWKEMRGKPGSQGIVTNAVVIVPHSKTIRRPKLRTLAKSFIAEKRKHHYWQISCHSSSLHLEGGDRAIGRTASKS